MRRPARPEAPSADPERGADAPFLERWSRRKRGLDAPAPAESPPPEPPAEPVPELTDEDMPDLATIDEGGDVSPFFSPGVSEELRQAALKRLFRSAVFNVRDGLDDYDEDYRSFESLGDVVTTEMRRRQEREEARLREKLARQEEAAGEDTPPRAEVPPGDGAGDAETVAAEAGGETTPETGSGEDDHGRA